MDTETVSTIAGALTGMAGFVIGMIIAIMLHAEGWRYWAIVAGVSVTVVMVAGVIAGTI